MRIPRSILLVFAILVGIPLILEDDHLMIQLMVLVPLMLLISIFQIMAVFWPRAQKDATRIARSLMGLWVLVALAGFFASGTDSVHILRNSYFAIQGILLASGLFLPGLWSAGEPSLEIAGRDKVPTILGPVLVIAFCAIPMIVLTLSPLDGRQVAGPLIPALLEIARYGFDGTIPTQMQPEVDYQILRNLGAPPREITVAMGATLIGLQCWSVMALIALMGRMMPRGGWRWRFYYLAAVASPFLLAFFGHGDQGPGIWGNAPWLVRSYGPVLLATVIITIVLLVAIWFDRKSIPKPASQSETLP